MDDFVRSGNPVASEDTGRVDGEIREREIYMTFHIFWPAIN